MLWRNFGALLHGGCVVVTRGTIVHFMVAVRAMY